MLMCRLPICSKCTGDDTICERRELPRHGPLMSQKFLSHSRPWTPYVMYQDVPLIASSAACYGNIRSNSLRVAFHSTVCHQEELMMGEHQRDQREKYREKGRLSANSHPVTREMSLWSNPSTSGLPSSLQPGPVLPHKSEKKLLNSAAVASSALGWWRSNLSRSLLPPRSLNTHRIAAGFLSYRQVTPKNRARQRGALVNDYRDHGSIGISKHQFVVCCVITRPRFNLPNVSWKHNQITIQSTSIAVEQELIRWWKLEVDRYVF